SQALARYWGTDYAWRKCEARLNALPNFITEIDGLDIHFIHSMACDGGGTRRRSTAGSRSRRAVMKASLRARQFLRIATPNTNCAPLEQSVRFGETNLAGVADGRAELQVGFPDIDEIPGSPSEFASTARNVHAMTGEGEA